MEKEYRIFKFWGHVENFEKELDEFVRTDEVIKNSLNSWRIKQILKYYQTNDTVEIVVLLESMVFELNQIY